MDEVKKRNVSKENKKKWFKAFTYENKLFYIERRNKLNINDLVYIEHSLIYFNLAGMLHINESQ